jgi:hypothetical protein
MGSDCSFLKILYEYDIMRHILGSAAPCQNFVGLLASSPVYIYTVCTEYKMQTFWIVIDAQNM